MSDVSMISARHAQGEPVVTGLRESVLGIDKQMQAALKDARRDNPALGGRSPAVSSVFIGTGALLGLLEAHDDRGELLATVDALKARLAAAEARAERAVGMVRRAYSIGYSAGCAGAPHSVRVDDLAALLKEVSHEG